jgi:hypothetical protein
MPVAGNISLYRWTLERKYPQGPSLPHAPWALLRIKKFTRRFNLGNSEFLAYADTNQRPFLPHACDGAQKGPLFSERGSVLKISIFRPAISRTIAMRNPGQVFKLKFWDKISRPRMPGLHPRPRRSWFRPHLPGCKELPVGKPWARQLNIACAVIGGVVCLLTATSAAAQEARLSNITLSNTDDRMVVSMRVEGAFTPEMIDAIHEGVETKFTFLIRLYRNRRMWLDEKLVSINLTHSLVYDPARAVYVVYRSWAREPSIETQSWAEAQALMSQISRSELLLPSRMQKGEGYELRAKAELSPVSLPYYLRYVLYFVSLWDFETEWHAVFFIY